MFDVAIIKEEPQWAQSNCKLEVVIVQAKHEKQSEEWNRGDYFDDAIWFLNKQRNLFRSYSSEDEFY